MIDCVPMAKKMVDMEINISQLSEKVGICPITLNKMINGGVFCTKHLDALCRFFNCQPNELMRIVK